MIDPLHLPERNHPQSSRLETARSPSAGEARSMSQSKDRYVGGVVLVAAALSLAPFLVIAYATWDLHRLVPEVHRQAVAVQELVGRIDYLDEALTASALLAASTGDPAWAERYMALDGEVRAAIDSLQTVAAAMEAPTGPRAIESVADTLATLEFLALDLVEAGELDRAWALLQSPAYTSAKADYQRGKAEMLGSVQRWSAEARGRTDDRLRTIVLLSAVSFLILLLVWGASVSIVRRQLAKRRRAEAELYGRVVEQERLESEVRRAEERLRAIVEVSPVAIVRVDPEYTVQFWNPAAERMFGWTADEVLGRPYPLAGAGHRAEVERLFRQGFTGDTLDGVEIRGQHKDGSEVDVRMWNAPVRDDSGEVRALVGVFADVTEQRHLEQRLRQAEKLEAIGRLAGGIAHDFNNVMTAVTGHAELLLEAVDAGSPVREDIEEIRRNADRATQLTRQLLAFSRRQVLQPRVLDLASVVVGIQPMLRRLLDEHIGLEVVASEGLGRVEADPSQVEQVIVNLAVNARDAMPDGGLLTIALDNTEITAAEAAEYDYEVKPGRYVRLGVSDTGEGMDASTQRQVFEPFFTTKRHNHGTGLGLATVFGIVKQSGGYLWLESEVGSGTLFEILLPRVDKPLSPAQTPATAPARNAGGDETILLVEDDHAVRALAERVLTRRGYHVIAAATPADALARIDAGDVEDLDLLVTDVVLPGMDGPELARRIARRHPDVPAIFMSGYTEDEVVREDIGSGPNAFLPKPFSPADLARSVRDVLDGRGTGGRETGGRGTGGPEPGEGSAGGGGP